MFDLVPPAATDLINIDLHAHQYSTIVALQAQKDADGSRNVSIECQSQLASRHRIELSRHIGIYPIHTLTANKSTLSFIWNRCSYVQLLAFESAGGIRALAG
jgi:hypothetical protein